MEWSEQINKTYQKVYGPAIYTIRSTHDETMLCGPMYTSSMTLINLRAMFQLLGLPSEKVAKLEKRMSESDILNGSKVVVVSLSDLRVMFVPTS